MKEQAPNFRGFARMLLSILVGTPAPLLAAATTFIVNSTNDPADGVCDATECTLREAIVAANANPGTDTISFNIPGAGVHTISPASALPTIVDPVIINGYSQPGASPNTSTTADNAVLLIELNGTNAGYANGLTITAGNSTVSGLVINRFGRVGVSIQRFGGSNTIPGNFIGTDATGTAARANAFDGVEIDNSGDNTIGGSTPAARNIISGNTERGVTMFNTSASGNMVHGNFIGTQADGTSALGNGFHGVLINLGASLNVVGGTGSGEGNVIAFNGASAGISVGSGTGNTFLGNSIFSNQNLGINLGPDGVTPNDACDTDTGANQLQNFPVITSAVSDGSSITIQGTLNSTANTLFRVEFFDNAACDASGHGEGKKFIGAVNTLTDANCNATFTTAIATAVAAGDVITSTASDSLSATQFTFPGNAGTSEFSACALVTPARSTPTPTPTPTPTASVAPAGREITGRGAIRTGGGEGSFEMNVQRHKGKSHKQFSYTDRSAGISFTSSNATLVFISGNHAEFRGSARGGHRGLHYVVDVVDGGRGSQDTFSIQLANGYSASGALTKGDISIHQ